MTSLRPIYLSIFFGLFVVAPSVGSDWAEWRGPARDGISHETGLPSKWSPTGLNLSWKAPYGGRSGPVVFGDHHALAPIGVCRVQPLPLGPLRAYVSAPGHRSAIVDTVIGDMPRLLRVALPSR